MPDFGFPAQPRQANLASLISALRNRSDDVRTETVTGRSADPTKKLNGRVNELLQIEKSLGDLQDYAQIIALSESRAATMQAALSTVVGIGNDLADEANLLSTNATDGNLEVLARDAREQFATAIAAFNSEFAGRSLFAGDETGTPALADPDTILTAALGVLESPPAGLTAYEALEAEFMNPGGLFDTTFYIGGAGSSSKTEVAPGEVVDYSAKADEDPVRRVLFNISVLALANDQSNAITDDRRELMKAGADGLRSGLSQLINVQSRIGSAEERIATAKTRNIAAEASLTISYNDLAGRDQFEAILELTEIENQLETAFATSSRLSNLSLLNFL